VDEMVSQNYYQFFEVSQDATSDEIKSAYRRLALKHHPDRNKNKKSSEQKMKEINFIYSILSDSRQRKSYDDTLGARDYFDDLAQRTQPKKTWVDIYCDDLEITDSTGQKSRIKVGENIYYAVDVDHSIFGWKYKRKEYFDVYVKKIFNPEKKNLFADALGFDFKKEPLCQAHFGEQDLIIYREDFQAYWLTEEHYNKLELKSGLATAFLVVLALVGGVYWLFATHPISAEQREDIKLTKLSAGAQITPKYKQTLIERYDATDGEINYIVTGQYLGCFKKIRKTKEFTEVRSAPDSYALVNGSIPKDTEVQILLYYEGHKAYKIKSDDLRGWVPERVLDNPDCTDEIK